MELKTKELLSIFEFLYNNFVGSLTVMISAEIFYESLAIVATSHSVQELEQNDQSVHLALHRPLGPRV